MDGLEYKNEKIYDITKIILISFILALFIKTFIFSSTYVLGNSMYPTLYEKDRLISYKIPLYFNKINRGDIIVFSAPDIPNKDYIKRVIGLPKEKVEIVKGNVYINGKLIDEEYLGIDTYTSTYTDEAWYLLEDEVFVLGDNRKEGASKDSRYFGAIKISSIKGITNFRYYPLDNRFGILE